jgi:hypothetical protein
MTAAFKSLPAALCSDENGFIVSAELCLVATVAVLALVVGLAEVSHNVNQELEDVGAAFSSLDQSFFADCVHACKAGKSGSSFDDSLDYCGGEWDIE